MLTNSVHIKNMCHKYLVASMALALFFPIIVTGQSFDKLVQMAWENNHELKAKNFQLESASQALLEAKAMYGPDIKFGVQYTLAKGGRSIDLPVGDLMNPVYSTLNQLTQSNAFSQIRNVEEQFLPNNFYDARLRISQPIYYPDLAINKQVKTELIHQKELEIRAFKRLISKQVMQAYIQYTSANHAIHILRSADTLLMEAKRSTQSMVRNGIALPTALSRLENESAELLSQQTEAIANRNNAENYLRFLLGIRDEVALPIVVTTSEMPPATLESEQKREELMQINQAIKLLSLSTKKEDNFYLPRIGTQFDAGSQDYSFGWQPYVLLGINVEVNIFDNKRHQYRKQATKSEILALQSMYEQADRQFALQSKIATENLDAAIIQANAYDGRIKATKKIYDEVFTKYKNGNANYIELVDAQNQFTHMQIQHLLAKNNAWIKWSELMYASAIYPIK